MKKLLVFALAVAAAGLFADAAPACDGGGLGSRLFGRFRARRAAAEAKVSMYSRTEVRTTSYGSAMAWPSGAMYSPAPVYAAPLPAARVHGHGSGASTMPAPGSFQMTPVQVTPPTITATPPVVVHPPAGR